MNIREKKKKLAAAKRQRKVEQEVIAIGAGAGWWWLDGDGYTEYQDDTEKCIGSLLEGVRWLYDLPQDCSLFRAWNLQKFSNPKSAAKAIINEIDYQKYIEKQKAEAA